MCVVYDFCVCRYTLFHGSIRYCPLFAISNDIQLTILVGYLCSDSASRPDISSVRMCRCVSEVDTVSILQQHQGILVASTSLFQPEKRDRSQRLIKPMMFETFGFNWMRKAQPRAVLCLCYCAFLSVCAALVAS